MTTTLAAAVLYVASLAPLAPSGGYCELSLPCPIRVSDAIVWVEPMPRDLYDRGLDPLEWVCDALWSRGYDCRAAIREVE